MKKLLSCLMLSGILSFCDSSAQTFSLVKDINPGSRESEASFLTNVNGTIYFRATDGAHGLELWKSDGTQAGTVMIKDLTSLSGEWLLNFTNGGDVLYFMARDDNHGTELWKSDGTEEGTVMVKDINTTMQSFSNPHRLVNGDGVIYFTANDGIHGFELWKTNGTEAGTVMVKDINPGIDESRPGPKIVINGIVYFSATDGINGTELWKSDGTEAGTVMVKNIADGAASTVSPGGFLNLYHANGIIYFNANDGVRGGELWKSDGTEAGTMIVKDIGQGSSQTGVSAMIYINGTLYFSYYDGAQGYLLWKTDGTESGTIRIKVLNIDPFPSFASLNGSLYFRANDGVHGTELWKSDGTEAGTSMIKDIIPSSLGFEPIGAPTKIGGFLYFSANDGVHGNALWRSDGTAEGTILLQDPDPSSILGSVGEVTEANGKIFAVFNEPVNGVELWVGNIPPALPLRFLEFKGQLSNSTVALKWKTVNEEGTHSFTIQRSQDGIHYEDLATVLAANFPGIHNYSYVDPINNLQTTVYFYRLKQIDIDGRFTYSPVVRIGIKAETEFVDIYYNPSISELWCKINLSRSERIQWKIIDNSGRIIRHGYNYQNNGVTNFSVDVRSLARGIYYFSFIGNSLRKNLCFVRQ